jgi:DNA-binding CsgD family transcriptional regulator
VARNDEQYKTWLEFLGDILQQPLAVSPQYEEQLLDLLNHSFSGACSTRNRVNLPWDNHILACWPRNYVPNEPPGHYSLKQQPLLRWYVFTGQTGPQTVERVPCTIAGSKLKQAWEEVSRPWGMKHQLSIPLQMGGVDHDSYLIARPDRDFTDQELALAQLLQPILSGFALHFGVAAANWEPIPACSTHGLTPREMTILTLLSAGLTAESVARRSGISPRTVEKHLEHIYRKLDVGDRLMAVQRAFELGLLAPTRNNLPNDPVYGRG